jgi:predicted nuclease with TOPRIM domain
MNYAALLAVLVILGMAFPVLVRVANANGVPQSISIVAAALGAVLVLAWFFIRQRVIRYRAMGTRIESIKQKLLENPNITEHYFDQHEHLGDLLIATNRRREALSVFETYLILEKNAGKDLPKLEEKITKLKAHLDELN